MAGASTHVAVDNDFLCHTLSFCVVALGSRLHLSSFRPWRRGAQTGGPSPKDLGEYLIIIPDQNRLPYPHMGARRLPVGPRSNPARTSSAGGALCRSMRGDFLALGRNQTLRLARHGQGLCAPELATGRHRFVHRNISRLQKLGGFRTGRSALAVVIPIHRWRHRSPLMLL